MEYLHIQWLSFIFCFQLSRLLNQSRLQRPLASQWVTGVISIHKMMLALHPVAYVCVRLSYSCSNFLKALTKNSISNNRPNFDGIIHIRYAVPPYLAGISIIYLIPFDKVWLGSNTEAALWMHVLMSTSHSVVLTYLWFIPVYSVLIWWIDSD